MIEILGFLAMSVGSTVDPLLLPALFIGARSQSFGKAAAVGVVNGVAAIILFALLFGKSPYLEITLAKAVAGVMVASIGFGFGAWRRNKGAQEEQPDSGE